MTVRSISVKLSAEIASYVSNMRQAGQATKQFGGELTTLSATSKQKFNDVVRGGAVLGVGLTGAFAFAAKAALSFDKTMSQVGAVAGANAKQLGSLRQAAIDAGQATVFSATDAAQAEAELAKAGVSTADILGGALTGAINLAAAGQIGLADAATDVAKALNIFGLQGGQASHVADVLTAAANTSATDVGHMSQALNQAGLVAKQTGLSLEDTTGTLALFAQNGLEGSDAGTSFKVMLQALQSPSKQTKSLMDSLGISAYNVAGQFIGIAPLAQQLQEKLKGLTAAQRDAALAQIFGSDAVRAADILYTQGAAGLQKWITGVNQQGIATKTAQQQMNNLSGDIEQLKGSLETLAITSSGGATAGLRTLTQGATGLVNAVIDLPAPITETATVLSGIGGVGILAATGFVKAKAGADTLMTTLRDMGPAGSKAASALGKVGSVGGKLGLVGIAAVGAYEGFHLLGDWIEKETGPVARSVDGLTDSLTKFITTGNVSGTLATVFRANLSGIGSDLATISQQQDKLNTATQTFGNVTGMASGRAAQAVGIAQDKFNQATEQQRTDLAALDKSLVAIAQGGGIAQAQHAYDDLTASQGLNGQQTALLMSLLPGYSKAVADSATSTSALGGALTDTTGAITNTMSAADQLKASLDALNGNNISLMQAQDQLQQAFDDTTQSIKQNGKTAKDHGTILDDSTAKGRANRESLIGIAKAAGVVSQAVLDQGGSQTQANKVMADARAILITDAEKMGLSATAAGKLADQILSIPATASTTVSTPGLNTATSKITGYKTTLDKLDGRVVTTYVETNTLTGQQTFARHPGHKTERYGGVREHAEIGLLNAGIYSTASPARYAFAEPATGGEGFVPRRGDYARSTGILDTMASWYGGRFVPGGGGAMDGDGGGYTYAPTFNVQAPNPRFGVQDLAALQVRLDSVHRVGRRR